MKQLKPFRLLDWMDQSGVYWGAILIAAMMVVLSIALPDLSPSVNSSAIFLGISALCYTKFRHALKPIHPLNQKSSLKRKLHNTSGGMFFYRDLMGNLTALSFLIGIACGVSGLLGLIL